ncbi:MAG TPA: hypothetical protein VF137_00730 [Candidatus Dormibacteraeota bacterium]
MRPYDDFASEVYDRQSQALEFAAAWRLRHGGSAAAPGVVRLRVASGLRRLAGWVEGPGAMGLRPS